MNQLNYDIREFLLHQTFNNVDILLSNRAILKLDEDSLQQKIVEKRRGGYCFENNQYFYLKILDKGYQVSRKLARVVYGEEKVIVARTHQVTIVEINGRNFLVDVGFGPYTPCCMIPLDGDVVQAFNGKKYRISKMNELDFQLEIFKDGNYFSLYQFNLVEYIDADFKLANYYTNTHDDSKFTNSLVLSQQTESGTRFISNLIFSKIEGENRLDHHLKSSSEMYDVIAKYFEISLTEDECDKLFHIIRGMSKPDVSL